MSGKDTARWGTGTSITPATAPTLAALKFAGITTASVPLASSNGPGEERKIVEIRLNAPTNTSAGSYAGVITLLAAPRT